MSHLLGETGVGTVSPLYDIIISGGGPADLISKFEEHVEKYGVEKLVGVEVKDLELSGKIKKVIASDSKAFFAKTVVLAMGKRPRPLGVPGEKELIGIGGDVLLHL